MLDKFKLYYEELPSAYLDKAARLYRRNKKLKKAK